MANENLKYLPQYAIAHFCFTSIFHKTLLHDIIGFRWNHNKIKHLSVFRTNFRKNDGKTSLNDEIYYTFYVSYRTILVTILFVYNINSNDRSVIMSLIRNKIISHLHIISLHSKLILNILNPYLNKY